MKEFKPLVIGIDAQPRGIAVGVLSINSGSYIGHNWYPLSGDTPAQLLCLAMNTVKCFGKYYSPLIAMVEEPTATRSPSSTLLYALHGVALATLYSYCSICDRIVVPAWKSSSGLNAWARGTGNDKHGVVVKDRIPEGVQHLLHIEIENPPVADIFDALGIALAAYNINQELMKVADGQ